MIKLFRRMYAFMRMTFVADCPRCHKHFYGYNDYGIQVKHLHIHYRYVCHRCMDEIEAMQRVTVIEDKKYDNVTRIK